MKKDLDYFEEFSKGIAYISKAANILNEYVLKFDSEKSRQMEEEVHILENEADKIHHRISKYLIKDFLPPIEREDIISLTKRIDDIMDNIDDIFIRFDILDVRVLKPEICKLSALLLICTEKLTNMFTILSDKKKYDQVLNYIVEINDVEGRADTLYQEVIRELYKQETNPIEVIKWTTIYNRLEECFDSAEDVAECVRIIITKNS